MDFDTAFSTLFRLAREEDVGACLPLVQECTALLTSDAYVQGTFLHWAAYKDIPELIEYAVSQGMDVNCLNGDGETPLICAASNSATRATTWLLEHGAEANIGVGERPTAIVDAVIEGAIEIVQILIEHGADVNANYVTRHGETVNPLFFAEEYDYPEIAALLRQHGAVMPDRSEDAPQPRSYRDDILDHLAREIGPVDKLALHEAIAFSAVSMSIHIISPAADRAFRTLFTTGMCEEPLPIPSGKSGGDHVELMLKLPSDWRVDRESYEQDERSVWPVQWIRMCAHTIHEKGICLGPGEIVVGPRQLPDDWPFAGFLVAPSKVPAVRCEGDREVMFYSVTPMYQSELSLAEEEGVEKLVALCDASDLSDVYDDNRPSMVS